MTDRTPWIGCVRVHPGARSRTVLIWTEGSAPGPDDLAEEIDDPFELARERDCDAWAIVDRAERAPDGLRSPVRELNLAAPIRPGKVIAVGRNFRAHAREMGNEVPSEPLLFLKPSSCLLASGEPVALPSGYERIDMEGELVVVIGKTGRRVAHANALTHVAGYALGNDVSNRDLQRRDKQWTRAKGADGFGPLGPFIRMVAPGTELDVERIRVRAFLDDDLRQDAPLSDMVFDIPTIIAYITQTMTLEAGDLLFMGTPQGVATLSPGCVMRVELDGLDLGQLTNSVVADH